MGSLDRVLTQRLHRLDSQSSPLSAVEESSPLVGLSKRRNLRQKVNPAISPHRPRYPMTDLGQVASTWAKETRLRSSQSMLGMYAFPTRVIDNLSRPTSFASCIVASST